VPSFRSKLLIVILRLLRVKRAMNRLRERTEAGMRTHTEPTARQRMIFAITRGEMNGHAVWTIAPRKRASADRIVYLHGGVYVGSFASQHWEFMCKLAGALNCTVVAPDYPHAPEYCYRDTLDLVERVYLETLALAGPSGLVTVMGDSSGGGIALALAQRLRADGHRQPDNVVLLSPWLDAGLTNPEIPTLDKIDPFLGVEGMQWAGRVYARELDVSDPLVSPVNGVLSGLAPIALFIGTRDILLPDCRKLRDRAAAAGATIDYHEYSGMVHNWMLVPLPESTRVFQQIVHALERGQGSN
jgi:monoterpene epsilon-lactone hydrolase